MSNIKICDICKKEIGVISNYYNIKQIYLGGFHSVKLDICNICFDKIIKNIKKVKA